VKREQAIFGIFLKFQGKAGKKQQFVSVRPVQLYSAVVYCITDDLYTNGEKSQTHHCQTQAKKKLPKQLLPKPKHRQIHKKI
jgi:hypothetical protein